MIALHPFTVTLRPCKFTPGSFIWSIKRSGVRPAVARSTQSYPTFEEARLAMKAVLDRLVSDWRVGRPAAADTRSA